MNAARDSGEAAGSGGSRRFRWSAGTGGRLHWGWPAALVLLAIAYQLGRVGREADEANGREVLGLLDRLDRMALVYVSALSEAPDRSFFLDRYEVTNTEYARFLAASGYHPDQDAGFLLHIRGRGPAPSPARVARDLAERPVVHVSLADARAYARHHGKEIPTASEWMLAARGADPGGPFALNAAEAGLGGPARVGSFESARTRMRAFIGPSVYDLLGNVWEWTVSPSPTHPGAVSVKGGSFLESTRRIRPGLSGHEEPGNRNFALGFRCVVRDAAQWVREVLRHLPDESAATRAEVVRRLRGFGEPLRRLLARGRFEERVRWSAGRGLGVEHVVTLADGRVVLGGFDGALRVVDGDTGAVLGRRDDLGRIDAAVGADLDGDGAPELYVAAAEDTSFWPAAARRHESFVEDVTVPDLAIVRQRGRLTLVDPDTWRVLPWMDGPLDEVERRALDLRLEQGELERATGQPPPPPLLQGVERFGWFDGFVPRERRRLLRLDPAATDLATVWERGVPLVDRLVPVERSGELLAACAYRRRFVFDSDVDRPEPFNRILALLTLDADGEATRPPSYVPGGTASVAPLDDHARRLLIVTFTGHELVVDRSGGTPSASLLRETERNYYVDRAVSGPGPFAASLLVVDQDRDRAPTQVRLEALDRTGAVAASADLALRDESPPRRFPVEGSDATMLYWPDGTIVCLGADLTERWRREGATEVALDRGGAVALDFDRDGASEICVPWRLDGFLRLDAGSGEVIDAYRNPNALVLSLHRQEDGRGGRLLATVVDLGVLSFGPVRSAIDDEARRLLERLEAPAGDAGGPGR